MKTSIVIVTVVMVIALGICPVVQGAEHIEIVSVTSSVGNYPNPAYVVGNLINDSGMSGDTHSLADTCNKSGNFFSLTNGVELTFDLGTSYNIEDMWVWNFNDGSTLYGIKGAEIRYKVSLDEPNWTVVWDGEIGQNDGTAENPVNLIVDFNNVSARYVQIATVAPPNYNWSGGAYTGVGLNEVRFYTTGDIATCGQAIGYGYGLIGDVNRDCYVNFLDFASFALTWFDCMAPDDPACSHPWE